MTERHPLHPPGTFDVPGIAAKAPAPKDEIVIDQRAKYFYGDTTLVGVCSLNPDDFDMSRPIRYALRPMYLAWYAYLRGASGAHYYAQRSAQGPVTGPIDLTRTRGWDAATDVVEAADSYRGSIRTLVDGDQWTASSVGRPDARMAFRLRPRDQAAWDEEGLCHLDGTVVGPAMQTYHPDPAFDFYWRQLTFVVHGQILDDPVAGLGAIETAWGNGSDNWMDLPMYQRVEDHWVFSVVDYRDGGREVASMFTSLDGRLGAGLQLTDGDPTPVDAPRTEMELNDDELPALVRWTHGNGVRETVLETGTLASPSTPGRHLWQCGRTVPLDSDRDVAWSLAFVETLPRTVTAVRRAKPASRASAASHNSSTAPSPPR